MPAMAPPERLEEEEEDAVTVLEEVCADAGADVLDAMVDADVAVEEEAVVLPVVEATCATPNAKPS